MLTEWLEHYLREGVDHFYLVDHGSTDSSLSELKPYRREQVVDVVRDPRIHDPVTIINQAYLSRVQQETQWVLVVELDQLIYSRPPYATLADYLRSLDPQIGQVCVPCKIFGSSGMISPSPSPSPFPVSSTAAPRHPAPAPAKAPRAARPTTPLQLPLPLSPVPVSACVDSLVYRATYPPHTRSLTQSIIRTNCLDRLGWHRSQLKPSSQEIEITPDHQPLSGHDLEFQDIDEARLANSRLHCNHYGVQSFETFQRIKMAREDLTLAMRDRLRNYNYFNLFDGLANQQEDRELQQKVQQLQVFYGGRGHYREVTHGAVRLFWTPATQVFHIEPDVDFNLCFGDPVPGQEKNLVVRHIDHLIIYPEHRHGLMIHQNLATK